MKEDQLIKKNKDLDLENKKLKRQLLFEQQLRKKVERKLRINKRETQRLTMENQQLKRKPI
jgi:regulator of replication initiation timing